MGGLSPERNVSLTSGSLIAAALRRRGHQVLALDLYLGVDKTKIPSLFTDKDEATTIVSDVVPDIDALIAQNGGRTLPVGEGVIEACLAADTVFLALHGDIGENGQLQAMLDIHGIPYTGSGYIGSMLAMDKDVAKRMLRSEGILTPDWLRINAKQPPSAKELVDELGLPLVVKPCSCGSSVGVYIVNTQDELEKAILEAGRHESFIMVEKKIDGRELTCAYLSGEALPPVEIIPKKGFYDYANKYQADATVEICPAPIGEAATNAVYEATKKGFAALRLCSYARFDYILDADGRAWCLEANTLPGMTPTSLFPQEAAAVGMSYDELCERIALSALEK